MVLEPKSLSPKELLEPRARWGAPDVRADALRAGGWILPRQWSSLGFGAAIRASFLVHPRALPEHPCRLAKVRPAAPRATSLLHRGRSEKTTAMPGEKVR